MAQQLAAYRARPAAVATAHRTSALVSCLLPHSLLTHPWAKKSSRCTPGHCQACTAAASAGEVQTGSSGSHNKSSSSAGQRTQEAGRPLDAFIGPGLQLMEQAYSVHGSVLRLISPMDVDAVLDMYISHGLDRDPYWCRAWPSAICLAQQLLQRPELVAGKKVADFGAGLGVAGLAAALAGAKEVVLLDREPMALYCGLLSAAASGIQGITGIQQLAEEAAVVSNCSSSSQSSSVGGSSCPEAGQHVPSLELLQFAELYLQQAQQQKQQIEQQEQQQQPQPESRRNADSAVQPTQPATSNRSSDHPMLQQRLEQQVPQQSIPCTYRATPFDWSSSKVTERYDVVLACDVLYEAEAVDLVASVIPKLLKPGGSSTLLLADPPNRTVANRQRFLDLIAAAKPTGLLLQESNVEQCDVQQLDPEMLGGVTSESVAVQFMVFRAAVGNDTVGLKAL